MKPWIAVLPILSMSCSPAVISRIGPPVPPRGEECGIQVLEVGETPDRPHRDVGMVTLKNCQDYRTLPCRSWLEEAVCELGGHVAYIPDEQRPENLEDLQMVFRVLAAAYVADLRPDAETDPFLSSRTCDPVCGDGERCVNRECVPADQVDCDDPAPPDESEASDAPDKCLE